MDALQREDVEIELFALALQRCYGYDFHGYAAASFRRRVRALLASTGLASVSELTTLLIHDESFLPEVISRLSVPVSEMFRSPALFQVLRQQAMPLLASYPRINIWQAGCAHGEEAYSLAIVLKECGLYGRAQIYATDISETALARAREGIYPLREARLFSENYLRSGGSGSLSDWYTAMYNHIKLDESLKERISFVHHNLVSDGVFGEMQLVFCRNVLIYFGDQLQDRVLQLFRDSLVRGGFLGLGDREHLGHTALAAEFRALQPDVPLYRLQPGG